MANAIGRVIPLTSAMNVEFNELAGLMAAMSKTGTPVEEAVTSIQAILTTLSEPKKRPKNRLEDALADVGLTLADLRNQVANEGILPMLVGLKEAFDGNIESTAAVFGNVRALRGVLDLLGPQMDGNIELLNEMADSAGVLNEAVGAAQESIGFKMRQASVQGQIALQELGRAIEPLANFIFDRLVPGLQLVIGWLQSGNPVVRTLVQSVAVLGGVLVIAASALFAMAATLKLASFTLNGWLGLVKAAHGVVWLWRNALLATRIQMFLLAVQTKLSSIATWLNTTATTANTGTLWGRIAALLASRAAILAGVIATAAATAAQWAWNASMLANPIGLIILAIAGLIVGIVLLVKNFDWVKEKAQVAWDFILSAVQSVWNWIRSNWPLLLAIITGPVGLAVYAFVKFKDDIIGVFASVKDFIIGVWQGIWDFILGIINRIKNAPAELLESLPGGKFLQKAVVALPGFQQGGVVPGPVGRAQAAIVHGGEMVLPQPFAENMQRLLDGGVSALVGPAPGMATAMAGGGVPGGGYTDNRDMSITISEGAVVVHAAPGQDAAEIGEVVSQKLRAEIRAAYRAFDSGIHR